MVSNVTVILAVPTLPEGSVAIAVMSSAPSLRLTPFAIKAPPLKDAVTPLTVTSAVGSSTVQETVMEKVLKKLWLAGLVIVINGAFVSCSGTAEAGSERSLSPTTFDALTR